jgi:hypothetical protein
LMRAFHALRLLKQGALVRLDHFGALSRRTANKSAKARRRSGDPPDLEGPNSYILLGMRWRCVEVHPCYVGFALWYYRKSTVPSLPSGKGPSK